MMIGLMVAFLGLGAPSLGGGTSTTVQMGYATNGLSYLAVEQATRMNLGPHALEMGLGMIRTNFGARLYVRGRWDYVRPGFRLTVVGQMPLPQGEHTLLRP